MNSLNTRIEIWKRFLNVNEVKVTPEQSVKLLGTEMDYEQNFERHFSFLCVKQVINSMQSAVYKLGQTKRTKNCNKGLSFLKLQLMPPYTVFLYWKNGKENLKNPRLPLSSWLSLQLRRSIEKSGKVKMEAE